ncbi:stress response translation initiation inhibitor YciH [bacterium]
MTIPGDNTNLVYTTAHGSNCPTCGQTVKGCVCGSDQTQQRSQSKIRIRRDKKGRRGKTVTVISGLPLSDKALLEMAAEFKRKCGTGGSVKNREILIQGDRCQKLLQLLAEKGYDVKISGG